LNNRRIVPSGQFSGRTPCQEFGVRPKIMLLLPAGSDDATTFKSSNVGAECVAKFARLVLEH